MAAALLGIVLLPVLRSTLTCPEVADVSLGGLLVTHRSLFLPIALTPLLFLLAALTNNVSLPRFFGLRPCFLSRHVLTVKPLDLQLSVLRPVGRGVSLLLALGITLVHLIHLDSLLLFV